MKGLKASVLAAVTLVCFVSVMILPAFAMPKADLIPLTVKGITAANKTYDGKETAQVDFSKAVLDGVVPGDDVKLDTSKAIGNFKDKNAGKDKEVVITNFSLTGKNADKYEIKTIAPVFASIEKANAVVKADTVSKTYGEGDPEFTYKVEGLLQGDTLSGKLSREPGEDVGSYKITLGTLGNPNYNLTINEAHLLINIRLVSVIATKIQDKYFGDLSAIKENFDVAIVESINVIGILKQDDVALDDSKMVAYFEDTNIGTNKKVIIENLELTGEQSKNYMIQTPIIAFGNIIPKLEVTSVFATANGEEYKGGWTPHDVLLLINIPEGAEAVSYEYSTDNGSTWNDMENPLVISDEGSNELIFRFNTEDSQSTPGGNITVSIDKTPPAVEVVTDDLDSAKLITFTASDELSGINKASVSVKKDGVPIVTSLSENDFSFIPQGSGVYTIEVLDNAGNVSEPVEIEITAQDTIKPEIISTTPANGGEISGSLLIAEFSENILKSTEEKYIGIYRTSSDKLIERISISSSQAVIDGRVLKIQLSKSLDKNTSYYVLMDNGIVKDLSGNPFGGIDSKKLWRFITPKSSDALGLSAIQITNSNNKYMAFRDVDNTFRTVVAPTSSGKLSFSISPVLADKYAKYTLSTDNENVSISSNKISTTSPDVGSFNIDITVTKGEDSRVYTLKVLNYNLTLTDDSYGISSIKVTNYHGAVDIYEAVENNLNPRLIFSIDTNNYLSSAIKKKFASYKSNFTVAMPMEIELVLKTDDKTQKLSYSKEPLQIQIQIPSKYRGESDYRILRYNTDTDKVEEVSSTKSGNNITFSADTFGTFALIYKASSTSSNTDSDSSSSSRRGRGAIRIYYNQHEAYISGYNDKTFRPENNATRAEIVTIIARISPDYSNTLFYLSDFNDLDVGGWYLNYLGFASQKGITSGYEDGSFRPHSNMTRAEFSTIIANFLNLAPSYGTSFSDTGGHWASGYIEALYNIGIINGYVDNTFRPDAPITRAEVVKVINGATGKIANRFLINSNISKYQVPFVDIDPSHWAYYDIIEAAVTHEITDFH